MDSSKSRPVNQVNYLEHKIAKVIAKGGTLDFAGFMDLALYHPGLGYYCKNKWVSGGQGDFYTSNDLGGTFGYLLACDIHDAWLGAGCPEVYHVVECGPGMGKLALHLIQCITRNWPQMATALKYYLVEVGDGPRKTQQWQLAPILDGPVRIKWYSDLRQIPKLQYGTVLANELVDALPFHRIRRVSKNSLKEVRVGWEESQGFIEVLGPLSWELSQNLDVVPSLRVGEEIEVSLETQSWLRQLTQLMDHGRVLIIDYGCEVAEQQKRPLFKGTFRCYFQHQVDDHPYELIGDKDITADVNFTAIKTWAHRMGWTISWYGTQGKFIYKLMEQNKGEITELLGTDIRQHVLALATLTTPGGMGDIFKVLELQK